MLPDLGFLCLVLALLSSLGLVWVAGAGAFLDNKPLIHLTPRLFLWCALCVMLSFIALALSFVRDDFSVALVANHSHRDMPVFYKLAATWGNHEGSLLLWILVLVFWGSLLCRARMPADYKNRALGVLSLLLVSFLGFSLFTSNPFERFLPIPPVGGGGLNPLLQDPAMMMHPPLLYLGYVGFALPFALAMAYLCSPSHREDDRWVHWARTWALAAWACLTVGIALGSWWAYYELGWGGFWFWDPVENASFMPWLLGTALIHSLHLAARYTLFHLWSVMLAIACFGLTLLGTFLVRSGVLVSVHAFASDPARGVYLLTFFLLCVGVALVLANTRRQIWSLSKREIPTPWSRTYTLIVNNYVLSLCTAVVLCGTLFPLFAQSLGRGVWSVGAPYFNAVLLPLFLILMVLMAEAPMRSWDKRHIPAWGNVCLQVLYSGACAVGLYFPLRYFSGIDALLWVLPVLAVISRLAWHSIAIAWRRHLGAGVAHLGMAVCALGIVASHSFGAAQDVRLLPGESARVGAWHFVFIEEQRRIGPNYREQTLVLSTTFDGHGREYRIESAKRFYTVSEQTLSEAGISGGLWRDLYVTPGERFADGAWTMRLQVKPLAWLIWIGGMFMALGGALSGVLQYRKKPSSHHTKEMLAP